VLLDTETLNLNKNANGVFEISMKTLNSKERPKLLQRKLTSFDEPQERAINRVFEHIDADKRHDAFIDRYAKAPFATEKEMFQSFLDELVHLPENSVLVFHNTKFDEGVLINLMKQHGLDTKPFENLVRKDTLAMLKEKEGYYNLLPKERELIFDAVRRYTNSMLETKSNKLINPNNGDLAKAFMDLADDLMTASQKEVRGMVVAKDMNLYQMGVYFRKLGDSIYAQFQDIARANQALIIPPG
jgi:DNA polymerase III epsilon subunit-like protein